MVSAMLTDAFQDCDDGFPIRYRLDGKLFNLRRLQAKSKAQTDVLDELLYADDIAKNREEDARGYGPSFTRLKTVTTMISNSARKRLR